ncbi:MAG: hypothetical protein LBL39_07655, partial [Planctomycetaceae bacterium]|nr:hypothetical protein [Planctomycetaceae bacterium]
TATLASESAIYPATVVHRLSKIAASEQEVVKPLAEWAKSTKQLIDNLISSWESGDFDASEKHLDLIGKSIFELDTLRKSFISASGQKVEPEIVTDSSKTEQSESANLKSSDDILSKQYIPNIVAVEELQYGLERRYIFWKLAFAVESGEKFPASTNLNKTKEDLDKLVQLTLAAEKFLLGNKSTTPKGEKIGELWANYFETKNLVSCIEAYKKSIPENSKNPENSNGNVARNKIAETQLESFCSVVNVILYRFTDDRLTDKQVGYLKSSAVRNWHLELERWGCDVVSPKLLLSNIERYENSVGMSDMQNLFRSATRMAFSQSET